MLDEEIKERAELDLSSPTEEMMLWAKENIREDPDRTCQLIDDFRDIIYSRGECDPVRTDDAFLLRFLRSRKFSIESAYKLFINYHDFREENVDSYKGIGFSRLEQVGEYDLIQVPPYLDQLGRRILLYKIGNWPTGEFSPEDLFSATLLILELAMTEPNSQMRGGIVIVDCTNMTMQQVVCMTPSRAHKLLQIAVTSHPMKLNEVHIIYQSWLCDIIYNMMKPLLHEKMKEKIYFHGDNLEAFHKYVDPKCLPDIYGGVHKGYNYKDWITGFNKNPVVLQELRSIGYGV